MPAFNRDPDSDRLDYRLMIRSPVRRVHSRKLLIDIVTSLRQTGYELVEVDASWLATVHMFRDIGSYRRLGKAGDLDHVPYHG